MNLILKPPKKKPKLMTAEEFYDFINLPENVNRDFDLVRGEVVELSRPKVPHGIVCSNAVYLLGSYQRHVGHGLIASNDTGVILERDPDTVRGPDVAWYENILSYDELPNTWSEYPPLLAVEVLSPNDRADQVMRKITDYLTNGVRLVWVIDPMTKTVTVYRPEHTPELLVETHELTGGDVLPGFRCRVADFFFLPAAKKTNGKASKRKKK